MKSDEDVRMISAEAPVLLAKACELFILDLTIRAYCYSTIGDADKLKKKTVAREDVVMGACGSGSGRYDMSTSVGGAAGDAALTCAPPRHIARR
jgi:hypothetical protein